MTSPVEPIGRRERHKAETRRALTEAALSLFEERGFAATTVVDITDRADVAERTFFRYFPTKEAVLFPGFEEGQAAFTESLAARPAGEGLIDSIVAAFLEGVTLAEASRGYTTRAMAILNDEEASRDAITWRNLSRSVEFIEGALAHRAGIDLADERIRLAAGTGLVIVTQAYDEWVSDGAQSDLAAIITRKHETLRSLLTDH